MKRKPLEPRVPGERKDPYSLFEISGEMREIILEITEAQQDKDLDRIEELTHELIDILDRHSDKYEATVHVIKNSLNAAAGFKELADQFNAVYTAHNNLAKNLKERLFNDLNSLGLKSVDAGAFTVRTWTNSVPTLHVHAEAEDLPEEFQILEVDTDALRYALANGREVDGAELVKGEHLRIVVKK